MTRRAAKKDANHNEIAQALEAAGCTVFDCSRFGLGHPDILCVLPSGRLWLIEVKQESGEFTRDEVSWVARLANENYRVFTSPEQAAEAVRDETN
jgi:hypothetical protein